MAPEARRSNGSAVGPTVPLVSVIIPARNEATDLPAALDAVLAQDYPRQRMEVIVVDGGSSDATAEIALRHLAEPLLAGVDVITNPEGSTPSNLNTGLLAAKGDVVVRVDARSRIPPHYVRRCVELLASERRVAVVGGRQRAVANGHSAQARGIARTLNNRFAMGLARYRRPGARSGPTDTVYLGAFRRHDLLEVGGWDTEMKSNQDFELNRRLAQHLGAPVWFADDLVVDYLGRATQLEILAQYHRFGRWKARYWRRQHARPQARQILLLIGPPALASAAAALWAITGGRGRRWLLLSGIVAAATLDAVGVSSGDEQPGDTGARMHGVLSMALVGTGWWTGVVRQWLHRR